jgi:hypothetical protein
VHAGISCASNRVGKTHCTAFNGLRWEAFAPGFLRWIDPTDRILVFTRVIWSHTKGLLTGMTLSSHQALTPATKDETIEVHATTQLFDLAFNQRVFTVQHEFPLMSPREQLDRILGRQLDNGEFTAPNLTIAKKCYSWAVFPTARGGKIDASKSLSAKNMSQLVINGFHEYVRYPPGVATSYSLRGGLIDISRKHNRASRIIPTPPIYRLIPPIFLEGFSYLNALFLRRAPHTKEMAPRPKEMAVRWEVFVSSGNS